MLSHVANTAVDATGQIEDQSGVENIVSRKHTIYFVNFRDTR